MSRRNIKNFILQQRVITSNKQPQGINTGKENTMKSYVCLSVRFSDRKKVYSYLADDPSIEKGDYVIVPAISDTVVQVVDVGFFTEKELPFDLRKMKKIKQLYRKKKDIHFEHPKIADEKTETDNPQGRRADLFKMLEGVEHEYHECLTEEDIKAYEEKNQISLPLEYRRFLKEIGNGIRFPEPNPQFRYRCGRLQYREIFGIELKKNSKYYKYSFPFGQEGYQDDKPFYPECAFNRGIDLEDVCLACDHRYICPDGIEDYTGNAMHHGSMEITYAGCSYFYNLILNGPHRGEIWASGEDWFKPFKGSFSEYLEWLLTSDGY